MDAQLHHTGPGKGRIAMRSTNTRSVKTPALMSMDVVTCAACGGFTVRGGYALSETALLLEIDSFTGWSLDIRGSVT